MSSDEIYFGYREIYEFLQKYFPNQELFTNKILYEMHVEHFGKEIRSASNIAASIATLMVKKMVIRAPEKTKDGF